MIDGAAINVQDFGAVGDGVMDDTLAIQTALDSLQEGDTLYFPTGDYGITSQLSFNTSLIKLKGSFKYGSKIQPITGWDGSPSLMHWGDGTTSAYLTIEHMAFLAAQGSLANDTDGLSINSFYNCDLFNIRCQGGNYVNRECAGLRIIDGRHTRIKDSQFHNSYCHGLIIESHLTGLNIEGNAFDESDCGIRIIQETATDGNILEMLIANNEFGSSRANSLYPAPSSGKNIDLGVGTHGRININGNTFSGGGGTDFHIYWAGTVDNMTITGNQLGGASRYSIAQDLSGARNLTIVGNTFFSNGSGATDIDPANGTRDALTSPFCADIYIRAAFVYPTNIVGNVTTLSDRPMAWVEGTGGGLPTSNCQISGNGCLFTEQAYVHQTRIERSQVLVSGRVI